MRKGLYSTALFLLVAGGLLMLLGRMGGGQREAALSLGGHRLLVRPGSIAVAEAPAQTPAPVSLPEFSALRAELGQMSLRLVAGDGFQMRGGAEYAVEGQMLTLRAGAAAGTVEITVPAGLLLTEVTAEARAGDVTLLGVTTAALTVETEEGDVYVSGLLTGSTYLRTGQGSIYAETASSGYDYTGVARSERGQVTIDGDPVGRGARLTGSGPHTMELQAGAGDITLRFTGARL